MLHFKTLEEAKTAAEEISALELKPVTIWRRYDFERQMEKPFFYMIFTLPDEQRHLDRVVYSVVNYESPYCVSYISPKHNIKLEESYPTFEQRKQRYNELIQTKYWEDVCIFNL